MIKVGLFSADPNWPILRQTDGSSGVWGNVHFYVNQNGGKFDYVVVYDGLYEEIKVACRKENTILITGEPPTIKSYNGNFIKQFGRVITCQRNIKHDNVIFSQQSLSWGVGIDTVTKKVTKDFNFFEKLDINKMKKINAISVVTSAKTITSGHKKRLAFIKALSNRLGDRLQIFGDGIRHIPDKWDAIAPFKYHLVIENTVLEDYWTEKLADPLLAGALPIYYGCPNLSDYFSAGSVQNIDINHTTESVTVIENLMHSDKYSELASEREMARQLVLNRYNLFPMIVGNLLSRNLTAKHSLIRIVPEQAKEPFLLNLFRRKW